MALAVVAGNGYLDKLVWLVEPIRLENLNDWTGVTITELENAFEGVIDVSG